MTQPPIEPPAESQSDPHAGLHAESHTEPNAETHGEARSESHAGPHAEAQTESHGGPDGEARSESHAGPRAGAQIESHVEACGGARVAARAGSVRASAVALSYRVDGAEGAPVLVLGPSLGTTLVQWEPLLRAFTPYWRVVRYDLPGHGGTPPFAADDPADHPANEATGGAGSGAGSGAGGRAGSGATGGPTENPAENPADNPADNPAVGPVGGRPFTLDDLADAVLAILDGLGVDRFAYGGVSLGGAIGTTIAARPSTRDRLASLALISSSARFGEPAPWRARAALARAEGMAPIAAGQAARWFTPGFVERDPARVEQALTSLRGVDPESYARCLDALAEFDIRDRLADVRARTLVINGADDPATPPDHGRILAGGIPSARFHQLPDASHLAYVEHPDTIADLLGGHFRTTWPGRPTIAMAERHAAGMTVRREVLGDAHVDRAITRTDAFTADFQDLITRYAWGEIWTRPGLDRRTRSCIALTALVAGGHLDELAMHVRGALNNGLTPDEIAEVLLQTAVYCGVPAANAAFAIAQRTLQEQRQEQGQEQRQEQRQEQNRQQSREDSGQPGTG